LALVEMAFKSKRLLDWPPPGTEIEVHPDAPLLEAGKNRQIPDPTSDDVPGKEEVANPPPPLETGKSREIAAKVAGFGSTTVYRDAKFVVDEGVSELVEAMDATIARPARALSVKPPAPC
jgi:hypothetical protein